MAAEMPTTVMTGAQPVPWTADDGHPGDGPLAGPGASAVPPLRRRALGVAAVAAAWGLGVLPAALGQRCTMAMLFHRPCPGCGMTRAVRLLAAGHVGASLRMHPLALPVLGIWLLLMATTLWTTAIHGSPLAMMKGRLGRITLAAIAVVYTAVFMLWIARWFGLFGGPVPVD